MKTLVECEEGDKDAIDCMLHEVVMELHVVVMFTPLFHEDRNEMTRVRNVNNPMKIVEEISIHVQHIIAYPLVSGINIHQLTLDANELNVVVHRKLQRRDLLLL